jgi:hypothetical protein
MTKKIPEGSHLLEYNIDLIQSYAQKFKQQSGEAKSILKKAQIVGIIFFLYLFTLPILTAAALISILDPKERDYLSSNTITTNPKINYLELYIIFSWECVIAIILIISGLVHLF